MTAPALDRADVKVWVGNSRTAWQNLPPHSADAIITSPPYYGLRDYGVTGQIGLETTPDEYVTGLADLLTAWGTSVLKPQGSLWLNLGDTYSSGSGTPTDSMARLGERLGTGGGHKIADARRLRSPVQGVPAKSLLMIPHRVALALIDRGWILRNTIIWAKPNGMPSSVTDRLANKHEYLFHLVRGTGMRTWDYSVRLLTDAQRAWLAALVDGEGTIGILKSQRSDYNSYTPYIRVSSSTPALLERCVEITGIGTVRVHHDNAAPEHHRTMYVWQPSAKQAASVIGQIYGDLIAKREQAKVALALQDRLHSRGVKGQKLPATEEAARSAFHLLLKRLNQWETRDSGMPEPMARWLGPGGRCEPYIYDLDAIRQPPSAASEARYALGPVRLNDRTVNGGRVGGGYEATGPNPAGVNPGDVWQIATAPYAEAHYAVFPPELVRRPILATVPPGGLAVDPFLGSGTLAAMCRRLGRRCWGVELDEGNLPLIDRRIGDDSLFTTPDLAPAEDAAVGWEEPQLWP